MNGPSTSGNRPIIWAGLAIALLALGISAWRATGEWPAPAALAPTPVPPLPASTPTEPSVAELLRPGRRALSAVFVEVRPPDSPIRAGERADVAAIFRKGDDLPEDAAVVLRDVLVLATGLAVGDNQIEGRLDDAATPAVTPGVATTPTMPRPRKTFTVEVSVEDAQVVILAQQRGELRIGRCSTAACNDRDLTAP